MRLYEKWDTRVALQEILMWRDNNVKSVQKSVVNGNSQRKKKEEWEKIN